METTVISISNDLDYKLRNLRIADKPAPKTYVKTIKKPEGPKSAPKGKHKHGSLYTTEFYEIVIAWLYDDMLTLKQIAELLNRYHLKTARGLAWTSSNLNGALDTAKAWAIIEPRWIQWQLANFGGN